MKRGAYLALGVQEYWIVDPDSCWVERWAGAESGRLNQGEELVWRPRELGRAISIDLREVFRDVCEGSG